MFTSFKWYGVIFWITEDKGLVKTPVCKHQTGLQSCHAAQIELVFCMYFFRPGVF